MKQKHSSLAFLLALFCLAGTLAMASCASFKLVSQRPATGAAASVDASSSATSPDTSSQGTGVSTGSNAAEAQPDAVTAATN